MRISDWSSDVCSSDLLAGDVVDAAGQEVRGQRGGVLDGPDDDALELRLLAPPGRVGLEHDMRAGLDLGHAIGAEPQAGVGSVGFVGASVAVFGGHGEVRAVERSEEKTSELQSLMRIPYAVFW